MEFLIILFAIITFLSTLLGGFVILKFKNSLPYFFAFAAGSLMGVAFLDILPESINLANSSNLPIRYIFLTLIASFFLYSFIERFFLAHDIEESTHSHAHIMGPIGAGSLVFHSFFDGVAIGASFQVSSSVGLVVALAVIFHDFTDGINTVAVMFKNHQNSRRAVFFLAMDAIAPLLGITLLYFITIPQNFLPIILAIFAGEFIYIGASNLLPETHKYPSKKITIALALGIIFIIILTSFI